MVQVPHAFIVPRGKESVNNNFKSFLVVTDYPISQISLSSWLDEMSEN